ncbi:MAG: phosphatase PAP2 family protein [Bacillota bacterium]
MKQEFLRLETELLRLINRGCRIRLIDRLVREATRLGSPFFVVPVCVGAWVTGISGFEPMAKVSTQAMFALASSHAVVRFLKVVVKRKRPYLTLGNLMVRGPELKDLSFPSGHTAAAFSLATSFAAAFPGVGMLLTVLASLVGISRMYVGMHYPSDVIFGAFLGSASVWLARAIL